MKTLLLILSIFNFSFSTERIFQLYQDSSWATYTVVHPLKTVTSTSTDFSGFAKVTSIGEMSIIEVKVIADPKTFTCGIKFIDNYAIEIIEYHKHKEIKFKGYVVANRDNTYIVYGTLTFHGIDKDMRIPVRYEKVGDFINIYGKFDIYLDDFKLKRPKVFGMYIDKKLSIGFKMTSKMDE